MKRSLHINLLKLCRYNINVLLANCKGFNQSPRDGTVHRISYSSKAVTADLTILIEGSAVHSLCDDGFVSKTHQLLSLAVYRIGANGVFLETSWILGVEVSA